MMDAQHHRRGKGRVRHFYAMSCAAAGVLPYLPAAIRYDLFAKRSHVVRTWPACSAHARPRLHVCLSRPPAPTQVRQLPGKLLRSQRRAKCAKGLPDADSERGRRPRAAGADERRCRHLGFFQFVGGFGTGRRRRTLLLPLASSSARCSAKRRARWSHSAA
jgi:hypothetical protein